MQKVENIQGLKGSNPTEDVNAPYKKYYISSDKFDKEKMSFDIKFPKGNSDYILSKIVSVISNYEYAPGLVSKLNLLHEDIRMCSAYITENIKEARKGGEDYKMSIPMKYDTDNNIKLRNVLYVILIERIGFLHRLGQMDIDTLIKKYVMTYDVKNGKVEDDEIKEREYKMRTLHKQLKKMSYKEIEEDMMKRTEEDDDQKIKNNYLYHLVPKVRKTTEIFKLGAKKDNFVNKKVNMNDFYDFMEKIYKMNDPESEIYYECNIIISVSHNMIFFPNNGTKFSVNIDPTCIKLEYKINKAASKRVIKKKKIEKPLIIPKLIV